MGGGIHKFLNLKGWHPSNKANQKKIWIAEQKAIAREKAEKEAAQEVLRSQENFQFRKMAQSAGAGSSSSVSEVDNSSLSFMYAPPPGLQKKQEEEEEQRKEKELLLAGDDEAVKEFRQKLLQRDKAHEASLMQSKLEKAAGLRPKESLTIKDQVERFPFLKDAPVEGAYTTNVKVNFKPMGRQIRNVRCLRCGEWGHQSGDRECKLKNFNPHDAARQEREDPMNFFQKIGTEGKQDLVLKRAALPSEMCQSDAAQAGGSKRYDILLSDPEEESDPEREFLASLSKKEKKLLLQKLTESQGKSSKKSKKSKHKTDKERKSRKHKRSHRSSRDSSASDSDDSATSDDSDSEKDTHRKRDKRKRTKHKRKSEKKKRRKDDR